MLVLSRKPGQRIWIGDSIIITLVQVSGTIVRVGIEAPSDVKVFREELLPPTLASGPVAEASGGC